ncbi:MAG: HEPN domain-containing protein [candidate division KSB1 bacterium]|nr:HEPN domain-containing protein [candidate division KSB1 bacterium]
MTEEQKEIVEHRLLRARKTLASAKVLLDTQEYIGTVNRLYYACFYAVTALLETRELASSKHSGVLSFFNKHFVRPGLVREELGKFYKDLFERRREGDYTDFIEFTQERVSEMHQLAVNFVEEISRLAEKEIQ